MTSGRRRRPRFSGLEITATCLLIIIGLWNGIWYHQIAFPDNASWPILDTQPIIQSLYITNINVRRQGRQRKIVSTSQIVNLKSLFLQRNVTREVLTGTTRAIEAGQTHHEREINATFNHHQHHVLDKLPGAFANNSLYLQTIRLTTSYQSSIDDVHVDLFGFSGDAIRSDIAGWKAPCTNVPQEYMHNLLGRAGVKDKITLFCQLELDDHLEQRSIWIQMFLVPMVSVDYIPTISSLLWRCNVTTFMTKPQLKDRSDHSNATATVHIGIRHHSLQHVTRLATFAIPLNTGSLGVGSSIPIRGGGVAKSYFHQPPVAVGLCVSIYGMKPMVYLRQFVQHHLNVGFGSILIGVRGPEDSDELKHAQDLLQRYMERGEVALTHYQSPFTCDRVQGSEVDQMQFYQPCLYYHKGLTKYSATWDIDEFWIPPDTLHMDGHHNSPHFKMGVDKIVKPRKQGASVPGSVIHSSSWSTFPLSTRDDPLWQRSRYARSVSIADTLDAIDKYYVEHGCSTSFCFHMFPSRIVFAQNSITEANRSQWIDHDFQQRKVSYDNNWQKSVVNTNYAYLAGIHVAGSCSFERSLDTDAPSALLEIHFHRFSRRSACKPRRFDHEVYGSMHHFYDLIVLSRWPYNVHSGDNVTQPDEYASFYAKTVREQLKRNQPERVRS